MILESQIPSGPRERPRAPKNTLKVVEVDYQRQVVEAAHLFRWSVNHVRRSVTGAKNQRWTTATTVIGWPDLTCVRPPRLIFIELKGHNGCLTPEQEIVLGLLDACDGIQAFVSWPWEIDSVLELLR